MALRNSHSQAHHPHLKVSFGPKIAQLNLFKWAQYILLDCDGSRLPQAWEVMRGEEHRHYDE